MEDVLDTRLFLLAVICTNVAYVQSRMRTTKNKLYVHTLYYLQAILSVVLIKVPDCQKYNVRFENEGLLLEYRQAAALVGVHASCCRNLLAFVFFLTFLA